MDDELAEFLDPGLDLEVTGERDALIFGLDAEEQLADLRRVDRLAGVDRGLERVEESPLEHRPHRQESRVPLPSGIDPWEGAVVKLEAEVERQLQVVLADRVLDLGDESLRILRGLGRGSLRRRCREHLHHQVGDRPCRGQRS